MLLLFNYLLLLLNKINKILFNEQLFKKHRCKQILKLLNE